MNGLFRLRGQWILLFLVEAFALCENETDANSDWLLYMNGRTYLNLPEIGNWARYNGQQSNWTKLLLRRDPQLGDTSVLVDIRDQTYAVGQSEAAWGIASDCTGTGTGDMSINLTGTPFAYQAVYGTATGFAAFGSVVCGNEQMCTASCGGICGFCGLGLSNVTTSELQVVDDCAFALGVQAWVTTTTVTSTTTLTFTSTTTTFLGNTTTSTTSSLSVTHIIVKQHVHIIHEFHYNFLHANIDHHYPGGWLLFLSLHTDHCGTRGSRDTLLLRSCCGRALPQELRCRCGNWISRDQQSRR